MLQARPIVRSVTSTRTLLLWARTLPGRPFHALGAAIVSMLPLRCSYQYGDQFWVGSAAGTRSYPVHSADPPLATVARKVALAYRAGKTDRYSDRVA